MPRLSHTEVLRAIAVELLERGLHPDRARVLQEWKAQNDDTETEEPTTVKGKGKNA